MLDFSGSFSQVSLTNTNIFFQGVNACSTSFSRYERGRLKNKLCCSRCVQHITEIEFHWYSPGRRTLHPRSIYSLTSTCNWLRGPSPLLMKAAEKVRNEGADDFPIPSPHLPSFSLYSTCVFPLSEFALCRSLFFPPTPVCSSVFRFASFRFSQTKCRSSSPQVHHRENLGCLKPNAHHVSTTARTESHWVSVNAKAALLIN